MTDSDQTHCDWMRQAIALAQQAGEADEVPVGAIIVGPDGTCIATAENRRERDHDPTAHAEILVLRQAGSLLKTWRLNQCTLYVTLEPCPMCAGAILQGRVGRLVYGASDPKTGAVRTVLNLPDSACSFHHLTVVGGILADPCRQQLQAWFAQKRRDQRSATTMLKGSSMLKGSINPSKPYTEMPIEKSDT